MEGLTRMLQLETAKSEFKYHPDCEEEFGDLAGLIPNLEKRNIFVAGGHDNVTERLSRFMNIPIGVLPIKYLGLPLISKRMGMKDCKALVDKITGRLQGWKVKMLSYAGKVQLICSVLQGINQYWASIMPISKEVWDDIDGMMRAFL
ncbi:hypothetical protein LIER_16890 [Lithospermum erythrorhizon]|uniref:Uncharacterized protein n=1 Tax=Lithospermum erythrorhizon TaxID=34254 RepID=A0AAV3QCQ4_LITER